MMKRKVLIILPIALLCSCANNPSTNVVSPVVEEIQVEDTGIKIEENNIEVFYEEGLPHVCRSGSTHKTYLMMSPFGSLNVAGSNVKGEVSEKFYENTIVWEAEAGTPLPNSSSEVVSSVSGVTFRGWAYYSEDSDEIYPTYYKTVPAANGLALKAIFDGTVSSGGGSGPTPTPTPTQTGFGLYFSNDNIISGVAKGINMDGRDEYLCSSVSFTANQKFKIYDFANKVAFIDNFVFNAWSFGSSGDGAKIANYLTTDGDSWKALVAFTADVYVQLKYEDNAIYFKLK